MGLRVPATMDDELELELELELLVHEVTANLNTVQGRNTLPSEKNAIWQTIPNKINELSSTRREVEEVKKGYKETDKRKSGIQPSSDQDDRLRPPTIRTINHLRRCRPTNTGF